MHFKFMGNFYKKFYKNFKCLCQAGCILCGITTQNNADFCKHCEVQLPRNLYCCEHCAIPLEMLAGNDTLDKVLCGSCQSTPPPWDISLSSFVYAYPLDRLLIALKYKNRVDLAKSLAGLMAKDIIGSYAFNQIPPLKPDCLLPVPLHRWRELKRGYNQAYLLANNLSRELDIPVRTDLLQKIRHTPKQSQLSKSERQKNLRDAFVCLNQNDMPEYIALVDDVMTTGATATAISKVLLKAGVKRVDVWCCARAE